MFGLLLGVWSGFFARDVRFGLGGGVADGVVVLVVVYCLSLRVGRCVGWLWFAYGQLCWGSKWAVVFDGFVFGEASSFGAWICWLWWC